MTDYTFYILDFFSNWFVPCFGFGFGLGTIFILFNFALKRVITLFKYLTNERS